MNESVPVKIGRKNYLLSAQSSKDKKNLLEAGATVNKIAESFLKDSPSISNEDVLMLTCLSLSHELSDIRQKRLAENKMLEQLHNSLAEKLENLIK